MFHICHAAKQKMVPALIGKYNRALAAARVAVAGHDLTHNERNWFALYILVLIDRRQKRVILLSRRAGSLPELLAKDPVFQCEDFELEYVPRTGPGGRAPEGRKQQRTPQACGPAGQTPRRKGVTTP
jgi:hypothetical protein